jgi:hypothetical protein
MKASSFVHPTRYYYRNQIKEVDMEYIVHERDQQCMKNFRIKMKERDHVGNLGMVKWMEWIN